MARTDGDDGNTTPGIDSSRRRFLGLAGTAGAAGITGFLGPSRSESGLGRSPNSTLFATWRGNDPTSSITLQWLSAGPHPPSPVTVKLSPDDGNGTRHRTQSDIALFGASQLYRHRAEMTGLMEDTQYRIAIRGRDTGLTVKTAPRAATEPITFAEGGDIGTRSSVPRLHAQAAKWDPLFGFVGGDLAYGNGKSQRPWVTYLETWHRHMRAGDRLIPMVAAIGNHEVQSGMHGSPAEAPFFYSLFDNVHRERAYWALDLGETLSLIILDSNHTTKVAGAQTEWLEAALADRRDRPHLQVAYHVPAYPSSKPIDARDRDDIREHWVPLFERYDVDVVFEHDDHTYKRTHSLRGGEPVSKNGICYVGDGAWGQGPESVKSPEERPYLQKSASRLHVIRATLSPDGRQRFLAVDPDGRTVDRFDL